MLLDHLASAPAAFAGMFQDPKNRWFAVYLLTSLVAAFVVFRLQTRHEPEAAERGFIAFVFPPDVYGHPSARVDYLFYVVNKLIFAGIYAAMAAVAITAAAAVTGALSAVTTVPLFAVGEVAATLVTTLLFALAFDFGLWLQHYLAHRVPLFWEFHKVHHSAEVLTPFTAGRVHPLDDLMSYLFGGLAGGLMFGLCQSAFGSQAVMLGVLQLNLVFFLFYLFGFHLRHSHVWLPYTGLLGRILVSPAHHQIHHSSAERHWDRNMGFIFAIWDWMFGTLHVPARRREEFSFGIGPAGEEREYRSLWALYALPFVKAARLLGRPRGLAEELGFVEGSEPAAQPASTVPLGASVAIGRSSREPHSAQEPS
jgi:sterol desaturase/sphingolipid hydroxylase (fatty acid hydroxylase superfamily)